MNKQKITIKRYNLNHVLTENKIIFNTNNHYSKEDRPQPDDYREKVDGTDVKFWIEKFHKDNYQTMTLDKEDLKWMTEAFKIGRITKQFSHLYDDELEYTCKKHQDKMPDGEWFIRTDPVSLKYGMHGVGPYSNFKKIIESMVSTMHGHECFKKDDLTCTIYFMKWINMDCDKEFRIFVYNNEITAISAQYLYSVNDYLNNLSDEQIKNIIYKILNYFTENIKDNMTFLTNYVMDLSLICENETPYFIEPGPFGKDYASGSALYHWILDHNILHDSSEIELRYVNN
jgi:hypothetical protein